MVGSDVWIVRVGGSTVGIPFDQAPPAGRLVWVNIDIRSADFGKEVTDAVIAVPCFHAKESAETTVPATTATARSL